MAGIGLYGVYYSKAVFVDGAISKYSGASQMGKAISATFTPASNAAAPLYANNSIAEIDPNVANGGQLSVTLDRLKEAAQADIYGLTAVTSTVTVSSASVSGTGFDFTGSEESAPVGVAFIRQKQEDNSRNYHEVVVFAHVVFQPPEETANTKGQTLEWQTPSLTGTVSGASSALGSKPWKQTRTFPSQAAAIEWISTVFSAT